MNSQIIGYRISYFIFSIFVSCLIVFTIHKGFQRQDIITIPIFAILLFLIIDFSAKSNYQNKMEKFFNEGFESQSIEEFTKNNDAKKDFGKNTTYKFRTARAGLMSEGTLVNSGLEKDVSQKNDISKTQCPDKDGKKGFWVCNEMRYNNGKKVAGCGCMYDTESTDPKNIFLENKKNTLENSNNFGKNKTYKFRSARAGYMAEGTLVNSGLEKDVSQKDDISKSQCPPVNNKKGFWVCNEMIYNNGTKRTGCGCMYDLESNDPKNIFNENEKNLIMDEETYQKYASFQDKNIETQDQSAQDLSSQQQSAQQRSAQDSSAQRQLANQSGSKLSVTPSGDKKAKEAMDKQDERPDINKHLMDDGNNGLTNRNSETINPININVSYNNNRPYTVNDFNTADIDKNIPDKAKNNDINNYRFDDGRANRSVKSGIDNITQKYNPANVKNPMNKNQPKVDDNYEVKMMKRILNEQNDPSPVLLENSWSEFKPLDK
jgi:hypothetical protein